MHSPTTPFARYFRIEGEAVRDGYRGAVRRGERVSNYLT
jgi:hypothetical protein